MNLTIRKMTEQDLEPLHRLLSDPKVMRFLEPPFTKEQTADFLETGLSKNPRFSRLSWTEPSSVM